MESLHRVELGVLVSITVLQTEWRAQNDHTLDKGTTEDSKAFADEMEGK